MDSAAGRGPADLRPRLVTGSLMEVEGSAMRDGGEVFASLLKQFTNRLNAVKS